MHRIIHFIKRDRGASAIEYAFLASLIAIVIVAAITAIGPKLSNIFTNVVSAL